MANGNFGGGNGTQANPYLVEDADDLNAIRNYTGVKYYKQINDIDLSSYASWNPIDNTGVIYYDGGGHKISNLKILNYNEQYCGLFGYTTLIIANIGLVDVNIQSTGVYVGSILGFAKSSCTITNCYATGYVKGSEIVGGLSGGVSGSSKVVIDKCYSRVIVSAFRDAGGIHGASVQYGTVIRNSFMLAPYIIRLALSINTNFGDIVGQNSPSFASVINCYTIDSFEFRSE